MTIAPAPSVLAVAELVAAKAEAGYELGRVLGIPSRWAHRRADWWLGVVQAVEDELVPDRVIRWR
jgi:hypothetical protein